jgi:protein TonB
MLTALAINLFTLSALIILPLINPQGLPATLLQRSLTVPAPVPPARPQVHSVPHTTMQALTFHDPFLRPILIPRDPSMEPDAVPPSANLSIGDPSGAVIGGVESATAIFHSQPLAVVHPAQPTKAVASGGVTQGLLISHTTPVYPAIAKAAGLSGTIVLAAIISKAGTIEELRVVSGPNVFRQSALDAVRDWCYRPYLLNGQPVEVETTVNVVFSMGSR